MQLEKSYVINGSYSKMVENEVPQPNNRKHIRLPPSVPFLWEVKPGIPKKDWKPEKISVNPVPPPPVKLVASIPFEWEETPGKPLPCFSQPPSHSPLLLPPAESISLPSPPVYSEGYDDDDDDDDDDYDKNDDGDGNGSDGDDEQDGMFDLDLESFSFESDESFSSVPSLLANRLLSTVAISTAVPVKETSLVENNSGMPENPTLQASETDSSNSSYATGMTSLVGASFLECLFPLLPPNSSFLEKVGYSEKGATTPVELQNKDFPSESNCSAVVRRPPTLGEMIMMSRRRSLRRKAVQMRKQNMSMEFMTKRAFGCCHSGISSNWIKRLYGKRMWQLRLKLE